MLFGARFTTEDTYFALDGGPFPTTERETSRRWGVWTFSALHTPRSAMQAVAELLSEHANATRLTVDDERSWQACVESGLQWPSLSTVRGCCCCCWMLTTCLLCLSLMLLLRVRLNGRVTALNVGLGRRLVARSNGPTVHPQ